MLGRASNGSQYLTSGVPGMSRMPCIPALPPMLSGSRSSVRASTDVTEAQTRGMATPPSRARPSRDGKADSYRLCTTSRPRSCRPTARLSRNGRLGHSCGMCVIARRANVEALRVLGAPLLRTSILRSVTRHTCMRAMEAAGAILTDPQVGVAGHPPILG